ncbi:NAD(P)/FAD-dependent oxidoreductase [Microbacterium natoriense]
MNVQTLLTRTLDVAVIGHGPALAAVAEQLQKHAGSAAWAVVSTDGATSDSPLRSSNRVPRAVSTAFAMGDRVDLLVGQDIIAARAVIVAVDTPHRIPGEAALRGRGVSYCAACDGALASGQRVAAMIDSPAAAVELEHLNASAHLDAIGTSAALDAISPAVTYTARPTGLAAVSGKDRIEAVLLEDGTHLDVTHLFLLTSRVPASVLVPGIASDADDRIIVDSQSATNIPQVFAVGDGTTSRRNSNEMAEKAVLAALDLAASPAGQE